MQENKNVPIVFTPHALDSARKRGANEAEIRMAIQGAKWRSAKYGRIESEIEFDYNNDWNKKFYKFKKVNPVFILEDDKIIIITVYCLYY